MSFIQSLLYNVPTPVLGFLIVALYVALSVVGLFVIRTFYPSHKLKLHNDVAGSIFATLGVIYAVLLAFMVIVTWQNFDAADKNVVKEANYLADLYRDSTPMPDQFRVEVKTNLKEYVKEIIDDEWPIQSLGMRSEKVQDSQRKLWALYAGYQPKSEAQKVFFAESVKKFNEACEMRRQRLLDARSGINSLLYFILFVGGLITVGYTLLFGTENFGPQIVMTSMLAALIALTLFTIMALDYPFTGGISIKPDIFKTVLNTLLSS